VYHSLTLPLDWLQVVKFVLFVQHLKLLHYLFVVVVAVVVEQVESNTEPKIKYKIKN